MSEAPALRLELRASRLMAATLLLAHLAAGACLAAVLPGAAAVGAGVLLVLLGAAVTWDRALLRGRGSVRGLELRTDGAAAFTLADGQRLEGTVAPRRNVNPWWVTLPLRGASRRVLVVARDMLPPEEFRRLRMWALWGRVAKAADPRLAP